MITQADFDAARDSKALEAAKDHEGHVGDLDTCIRQSFYDGWNASLAHAIATGLPGDDVVDAEFFPIDGTSNPITTLIEAISSLAPGPWCETWTYAQVRHVERNCEVDCSADHADINDCRSFDRGDGDTLAKIANARELICTALRFYQEKHGGAA